VSRAEARAASPRARPASRGAPAAWRATALFCAAALGCSSARDQTTATPRDAGSALPSTAPEAPGSARILEDGAAKTAAAATLPAPERLLLREADAPYANFFAALRALEQRQRKDHVRVVWLGDSHGAADFWSGALRAALQRRFGDGGHGFVHLGYRAYRHDRVTTSVDGKWRMTPRQPAARVLTGDGIFGLGGIRFSPEGGPARAQLQVADEAPLRRLVWDLCFRLNAPTDELAVTLTGGQGAVLKAGADNPVGELQHAKLTSEGPATLRVVASGAPELCGAVIEAEPTAGPGVVIDTLGINGARLATPLSWSSPHWSAELARRSPELVIFEYGTNESGDLTVDPALYGRRLAELVARVRAVVPDSDCLVLAPTDRRDTQERTPLVRDALRRAARELGCGFWDTYETMGGRGAIEAWRKEKPPRAMRDGVHLAARGYRELGGRLAEDLLQRYRP
jgi:lysophospholipase L1-like esterase